MTQETTIKISKRTLEELKKLRAETGSATMNDVILALIEERHRLLLSSAFGAAREKLRPFSEEDRGEDRRRFIRLGRGIPRRR